MGFPTPEGLPELQYAVEEYRALIASAIARSLDVYPSFANDLLLANQIVTSRIKTAEPESSANATAMLVDINAALSRFASQAFSGSSPIRETECHFWTHSLLGTGVANIALANTRNFLKKTLGEARIPELVMKYKNIQRDLPTLTAMQFDDGRWNKEWIDKADPIENRQPLFPQITYFSGRDGFKTTETTLSAPLNAITSCSSTRWTLHTITHEASHTVISGVLGVIFPRFNDPTELQSTVDLVNGTPATNLLEEIRRFVFRVMIEMTQQSDDVVAHDPQNAADIIEVARRWRGEAEEIMVHTFDFLFFYGEKTNEYIPAIWRSWDTIPHLNPKLHEYLIRTICVAASKYLGEPNAFKSACVDAQRALKAAADTLRPDSYAGLALGELDEANKISVEFEKEIQVRLSLVALVKSFLHSPQLVQKVRGQYGSSKRAAPLKHEASTELEFLGDRIDNPLAFIEDEVSFEADEAKSLWILQRLAFEVE